MKTIVIVLHYGDINVTKACILSLLKNEKAKFDLCIVNNANEKINSNAFKTLKKILIFNNINNLGFSGGVNIGIRYGIKEKYDLFILLNNDTQIKKPFIGELVNFLSKNQKVGIIAPAINFIKNGHKIYDLGGRVNSFFGNTYHDEVEKIVTNLPHKTDYASGCCMAIKKEVFEKIGLFDEDYFLYYEDVDFCLRARKSGFFTYIFPRISIFHELSKSAGKISKIAVVNLTRSSLIFGKKNIVFYKRPFQIIYVFLISLNYFRKDINSGIIAFKTIVNYYLPSFK